ncbi:hypothetical protein LMH87_003978 [Akanthomyces muscarius]|uniref:15-O-acetyltransferase n=1 Tax=Akanthomyces muscarius TaxID=2231603 RepID=A0A9W8Q4H5_AKAMU|nr:hypothetical protein LMH87_003978 [Akanthomyces muscarius]KAJ4145119.1 hypothetical protein LMH87_003978 [Akanthomyces muscarius]
MTVPSATELPALAPKAHRWEKSNTNEHSIQRRSVGAEAIVGLEGQNRKGQYDLYMVATLETVVPVTSATVLTLAHLKEKFELALLAARFQHPECAATVSWDEHVSAIISYQPPKDNEAALAWAKDCIHIQPTTRSAYDVWGELEMERSANNVIIPSKSFEVFLLANVLHQDARIPAGAAVDVLIHTNHLFWDGISCLGQSAPKFNWGQEVKNLCPPILDSLSIDVETLGAEFDNKCKEYTSALVGNYSSRGLPFTPGLGLPRCELLTLSAENSKSVIKNIKTRLGPEFTITHLTQAAILLALLDTLKPTDLTDDEVFVTPTSVDGRRWMRPEVANSFYSMCQTAAVVRVENLKSIHVSHEDSSETQVKALERACRDVKASYDQWLKNPYQQALGLRVHNFEASYLQANPIPFQKKEANPLFISDGINERFLPRDIVSSATAETIFTVERFSFLVNQMLPYLAIRLDSWKDASTVSIIYNEANYTKAVVQAFLKSITDFILVFMA